MQDNEQTAMADENKKKKPDQPPEGFLTNIFRPWKRQRVTLTPLGKRAAPTGKARAKKGVAKKKAAVKKTSSKKGKKTVAKVAAPATAHERQVNELKTLARIGHRDPERLASIISKMLLDEEEKQRHDRLQFERLIWEKAEKRGGTGNGDQKEE